MNERQLLVNRELPAIDPNDPERVSWYNSTRLLRSYPSVEMADFYNTCSSAGDWQGYIVQKIKNRRYLIHFWQESNYPRHGYTLHTELPLASWSGFLPKESVLAILNDYIEEYFS